MTAKQKFYKNQKAKLLRRLDELVELGGKKEEAYKIIASEEDMSINTVKKILLDPNYRCNKRTKTKKLT